MHNLNTKDIQKLLTIGITTQQIQILDSTELTDLIQEQYSKYLSNRSLNHLLIEPTDNYSTANTYPTIICANPNSSIEHEASTSKINEQILFFLQSRGLSMEQSVSLVVSGFCDEVMSNLPFEFAVEAKKLLEINMEGSVG